MVKVCIVPSYIEMAFSTIWSGLSPYVGSVSGPSALGVPKYEA